MSVSNWIVLIIELLGVGLAVTISMKQYISFKKTPFYALFTAWLGWYLCFNIVFLVPIDILASRHNDCIDKINNSTACKNATVVLPECNTSQMCPEPISYLPDSVMVVQWSVLYWGTFILSWVIFPVLQTYSGTGDFRFRERIMRSIKENIILYSFMGIFGLVIGIVILIFFRDKPLTALVEALFTLINVYGLVLVVITMGFGLVDVPRNLLRKSNHYRTLRHYRIQAVVLKSELDEAQRLLEEHLRLIKATSDKAGEFDPFRRYLDIIISKCPLEFDTIDTDDIQVPDLTYSKVVEMHANLMDYTHMAERSDAMYTRLLGKAFAAEDIIATLESPKENREKRIKWSFKNGSTSPSKAKWEYYWHLYIYPNFYKVVGAFCAIMSLLVVWAEVSLSFGSRVKSVSPFALVIYSTSASLSGFGLQIFCFIPLLYMAICAYTTLFKIRIFNYYRLVPQQQTNSLSIMFSSNYLGRLAAPLSFNFIQICGMNDSSFSAAMGDTDAFALKNFNLYFPIIVGVVCIISLFSIHTRVASMCCIKSLRVVTDTSEAAAEKGVKILKQVRDAQVEGVPPPKTRMGVLKDFITGKGSKKKSTATDGATDTRPQPQRPVYKAPQQKSTVMMGLSRDYTSKNGTTFKSVKTNEANNAILTSDTRSSDARLESKGLNYWDKLKFKYDSDDDDDIEMGKF
ncbi:hypothetical protein SAMD00019534_085390 [Acytostelium subglobosum LB1]|uniref:hypothetical protein n=1 Tax=Acytostelium subglobosum LB1 TaxID=1410327 RepID=UPI0006447F8F|nr:hypothetical protein SAMD00019534_085390 [Acytostelium subglobosum LB1]GAM25364.1 hypothetical protein SAMD00019534_085390 [Acytostelium subglobosum LB1]|eukprot:XP_012751884.1 hypothetical protein SAMD00019534_085390 [Acytostelium subglobosum LB1]